MLRSGPCSEVVGSVGRFRANCISVIVHVPVRLSVSRPPCDAIFRLRVVWLLLMPYAVHLESVSCAVGCLDPSTICGVVCKWCELRDGVFLAVFVQSYDIRYERLTIREPIEYINNCAQASCDCVSSTGHELSPVQFLAVHSVKICHSIEICRQRETVLHK